VHTSTTDLSYTAQEASVEKGVYGSTTPELRAKGMAELRAQEQKTIDKQKKGSDKQSRSCPFKQDFMATVTNVGGVNCTKKISSTGQALNMHVTCKAEDGSAGYEQINKFERIDAETFQGTVQAITRVAILGTITQTYTGKWIGDSCSGPPAGYAAKNGLHPKGPANVARDDPNRVVAMINGKEITAQQGWNMIKKVPPATRSAFDSKLPNLLQRLYLQNVIAGEAIKLHLDKQQPWKDQLNKARLQDLQRVQNYAGDPNIPPEVRAQWEDDQQHILWHAYFAQGATKEENDALLKKEQEKYKITVKDADFFNGVTKP
jgi:hypothetical protein